MAAHGVGLLAATQTLTAALQVDIYSLGVVL